MTIIGRGYPGKALVTRGYGESLAESISVSIEVTGCVAYTSVGRVKAIGQIPSSGYVQAYAYVEHERAYVTGIRAKTGVGKVTVGTGVGVEVNSNQLTTKVGTVTAIGGISVITRIVGVRAATAVGVVDTAIHKHIHIAGVGVISQVGKVNAKTVDRRKVEDEELIQFLLAA